MDVPSTVPQLTPRLGPSPAEQLAWLIRRQVPGHDLHPIEHNGRNGFDASGLWIGPCVTLKGTRGGLDRGALITSTHRDHDGPVFFIAGQNVRIEGLRFRGPMTTDDRSPQRRPASKRIAVIDDATAAIDNNVFEFWSMAVVVDRPSDGRCPAATSAPPVSITRNYFNRNAIEDEGLWRRHRRRLRDDRGEPVQQEPSRRGVKRSRRRTARVTWRATTTCSKAGSPSAGDGFCYWNQHFDVHGSGDGGTVARLANTSTSAWNTIRGEQGYYQIQTRPAFMLRGKPTLGAYFHDNVVVHDNAAKRCG